MKISAKDFKALVAKHKAKPIVLHRPTDRLNKTEAAWAEHLELLMRGGAIRWYRMQPVKLVLASNCTYTPDSLHQENDGRLMFTEIKGFLRDDALIKFKAAAEITPWASFQMIRRVKGGWNTLYTTFNRSEA